MDNEQRKQSFLDEPSKCPMCKSTDIRQQDDYYETKLYFLYMRCEKCDASWTEEYKMSDVWITEYGTQDLDTPVPN